MTENDASDGVKNAKTAKVNDNEMWLLTALNSETTCARCLKESPTNLSPSTQRAGLIA